MESGQITQSAGGRWLTAKVRREEKEETLLKRADCLFGFSADEFSASVFQHNLNSVPENRL
jgi:hypothetical protein